MARDAVAREKKRERDRRYRESHREELRAWDRKYRQEHPERERASDRRYRETHQGEIRAYMQRYRLEHREEIQAWHRQYAKTKGRRASYARAQRRRRATKAGLPATLTEVEWQYALAYFGNRCAYCGASHIPLAQEHVVPLSMGGGYVAGNIVPACKACNCSKNTTAIAEWAEGRGAEFVLPDALARVGAYLVSVEQASG